MPYFHNFVLTSLKVTITWFDKLQFWYSKFAVLVITTLHPIIFLTYEVDGKGNSFKSSLCDSSDV